MRLLSACFVLSLLAVAAVRADTVIELPLPANDLVYHAASGLLYASVPGTSPVFPNTITRINPSTAQVVGAVPIGSEPASLALTDDGQYLYVGLNGVAAVRRYEVSTHTAGLQWPLGEYDGRQLFPSRLATLPGQPHAVAVARRDEHGAAPLGVYDDGVLRPYRSYPGLLNFDSVTGSLSPARLYGNWIFNLTPTALTPQGLESLFAAGDLLGYPVTPWVEFQRGLLFAPSGRVVEPEGREILGTFPDLMGSETRVCPDLPHGRVFFLSRDGFGPACTLRAYDARTFAFIGSTAFPEAGGPLSSLVRWGSDGLAFATGTKLHLIHSAWIPQTAPAVDLELTSSSLPEQVPAGETLSYTLTVTNSGPNTATNIILADTVPGYTTVVSATLSQGTEVHSGGVITARFGDLAPNQTATLTVQIRVAVTGTASHSARVVAYETDTDPSDDQVAGTIAVTTPLLAELDAQWEGLTVKCPKQGKCQFQGKLTLRNQGGQDARKFTVRFYLAEYPDLAPRAPVFKEVKVARLKPGKSMTLRLNKKAHVAFYRYLLAVVDPANGVPEANEEDNATVTVMTLR